ncbi:unnamed protein product [Chrysoparadoxa australica]
MLVAVVGSPSPFKGREGGGEMDNVVIASGASSPLAAANVLRMRNAANKALEKGAVDKAWLSRMRHVAVPLSEEELAAKQAKEEMAAKAFLAAVQPLVPGVERLRTQSLRKQLPKLLNLRSLLGSHRTGAYHDVEGQTGPLRAMTKDIATKVVPLGNSDQTYLAQVKDEGSIEVAQQGAEHDQNEIHHHVLRKALGALAMYLAIGLVLFMNIEGWGAIDTLYFSLATVTTVGYGDVSPTTDAGKVVTMLYAMEGLSLLIELLSVAGKVLLENIIESPAKLLQKAKEQLAKRQEESPVKSGCLEAVSKLWQKLPRKVRMMIVSRTLMWLAILFGMLFYGSLPGEHLGYFDAMYMSAMTITSVGYGDFSPKSQWGRAFAIVWMPCSCVVAGYALSMVMKAVLKDHQNKVQMEVLKKKLTLEDLKDIDDDEDGVISQAEYILFKIERMGLVRPEEINEIAREFVVAERNGMLVVQDDDKEAEKQITST